jgi:AcrR family transcriptional regulator
MTAGLRDRKKQATRLAISDIATELFARNGFESVSIAQVAEAAGVSKMTVTNYFRRKEDLVFDRHEQLVGELARVVADRGPGETPLDAVRRDYLAAVARHDVTLGFSGVEFARMVDGSPVLLAALSEHMHQREVALAAVLRESERTDDKRTDSQGADPNSAGANSAGPAGIADAMAQFQATQLGSVHRVLFADARRRTLAGQTRAEIAAALTEAATRMFDSLATRYPQR